MINPLRNIAFVALGAFTLAACTPSATTTTAPNTAANANSAANSKTNTAAPVAAAPTKDALVALEKGGWEGWKNRDPKVFDELALLEIHGIRVRSKSR
jgi:hypothetical protein